MLVFAAHDSFSAQSCLEGCFIDGAEPIDFSTLSRQSSTMSLVVVRERLNHAQLIELLSNDRIEQLFLVYTPAIVHFAQAYKNGQDETIARKDWLHSTLGLKEIHRTNPQKVTIISCADFYDIDFNFFGYDLCVLHHKAPGKFESDVPDNFFFMAANQLIQSDFALSERDSYLKSCESKSPNCKDIPVNISQVVFDLKNAQQSVMQEKAQITAELEVLTKRSAEYFINLQQSIADHNTTILSLAETEKKLTEAQNLSIQRESQIGQLDDTHTQTLHSLNTALAEKEEYRVRYSLASYEANYLTQMLARLMSSRLYRLSLHLPFLGFKLKSFQHSLERFRSDEVCLLLNSKLFDGDWYIQKYKDVADTGVNPAVHYLKYGAAEGRQPGPNFDGNWYLQTNKDVQKARLNPLMHYLAYGEKEGRPIKPVAK